MRHYFDEVYLRRWQLGGPDKEVRRNAKFIVAALGAAPGHTMLDVACGQGRYSVAFAELGLDVVGLDASKPLLNEARRLAATCGVDVQWVLGDMRDLGYSARFDHAVLIDSFGFFDLESDDSRVLEQLHTALRRGGSAALVLVNGERILANFQASARECVNGETISIERSLDAETRILKEYLTIDGVRRKDEATRQQRLYSGAMLSEGAKQAGFEVTNLFGDLRGGAYHAATSPRIVLLTKRKSSIG